MGLDRVSLLHTDRPDREFFDELNAEFVLESDQRERFVFGRVIDQVGDGKTLHEFSEFSVTAKRGSALWFHIDLNMYVSGSNQAPLTRFECNPNKFDRGWLDLQKLLKWIYPRGVPDMWASRVDLNAEVENVPMDYLKSSMRIPGKRKIEELGQVWKDRGVTGFRLGKQPAFVRCYDKPAEMRYRKETDYIHRLPENLHRIEWQLHGRRIAPITGMGERRHATWIDDGKPPQVHLSELPNLQESRPFDRLEFLSIDPASTYNWHNETARSIHLATADKLIAELQAHDAVRALNHMGHYKRDYKRFIVDNTELRQRIHASYEKGIRRFFSGKGADIKHIYCHCSWCGEFAEQLKQTDCCGVRLCPGCEDQKLGHEITCSTYSVS